MAFNVGDLRLVQRLKNQGYLPNGSAVIEIGAQQIDESIIAHKSELEALGRAFGIDAPCPPLAVNHSDQSHRLAGAPMARELWQWLGLEYASIDIDGSPGSIPLDLNCDEVPPPARAKYRLVTNFGTTEHVANQLHAFKVIHDLTKVNGVMIHNVPCHLIDHGLFGYNPNFFWMLSRSNAYRVIYMNMTSGEAANLPDHIISTMSEFVPDFAKTWKNFRETPCSLLVAMQKLYYTDYVAPIDVGSQATDNAALKARYWTVFDREALDKAIQASDEWRLLMQLRIVLSRRMPWLVKFKRRILSALGRS
jgi:hypothetical protein